MAKIVQMPRKAKADNDPFDPAKLSLNNLELADDEVPCRPVLTTKQRRQRAHFVKVPLEWAERATKALHVPQAYVMIWLLYRAWKTGSNTVVLSNRPIHYINRSTKRRALLKLEKAGLIRVDRGRGRAPVVTLVGL
jgi:hypothetical protein